ncbi:MAG: ribonuclease P protein component [Pseudomonadota bacterium]
MAWARLRRRSDFLALEKTGRRWVGRGIIVRASPASPSQPKGADTQVGLTVSRRHGGAVRRNRIKRRLRAAIRTLTASPQQGNVVLIARPAMAHLTFAQVCQDLRTGLAAVGMVAHARGKRPARKD